MDKKIKVTDNAYPYLILQKGALWEYKDNKKLWIENYNRSIGNTLETIKPFLPEKCDSVFDVGSGMGGINILVNRYYGGDVHVTLLDGVDDEPYMRSHNQTFNHMGIAEDFLTTNGVKEFSCFGKPMKRPTTYDLILSFGAWCFHFPPDEYLNTVKERCHQGTVIILDVRNTRQEWLEELNREFGDNQIIRETRKFTKRAWVIQ